MFVLGVFTDPGHAKQAIAEHTGRNGELVWRAVDWEHGWSARSATMVWSDRGEDIPLQFWIIPFLLNRSELGDLTVRVPKASHQ